MKAPNKIFAGMAAGHLYARLTPTKLFGEEFSEYIRKNLLLEWANELTSEPYDRTTESALKRQIAHYLLEKYNSL